MSSFRKDRLPRHFLSEQLFRQPPRFLTASQHEIVEALPLGRRCHRLQNSLQLFKLPKYFCIWKCGEVYSVFACSAYKDLQSIIVFFIIVVNVSGRNTAAAALLSLIGSSFGKSTASWKCANFSQLNVGPEWDVCFRVVWQKQRGKEINLRFFLVSFVEEGEWKRKDDESMLMR